MSIISFKFIIFVIAGLLMYYTLPKKMQWIVLLILSYTFYLFGGIKTVAYLLFTTLTTYLSGILLSKEENKKKRKLIVTFSIIANFGLLYFLKYWNFTADTINGILNTSIQSLNLIMPLRNIILHIPVNRICSRRI